MPHEDTVGGALPGRGVGAQGWPQTVRKPVLWDSLMGGELPDADVCGRPFADSYTLVFRVPVCVCLYISYSGLKRNTFECNYFQ